MKGMFEECNELEYIDLSNFISNNVTNFGLLFSQCIKLKEIKGINKFNTSKLISIYIEIERTKK